MRAPGVIAMRRPAFTVLVVLSVAVGALDGAAQSRKKTTVQPSFTGVKTAAADRTCPSDLGSGVATKRTFCDVLTGRDPAEGIIVRIPAHRGTATLLFDLHNRHTYSEEQVKANAAYTRYTATVGVLTMANDLLERGVVQSEFRTASDLLDRVEGGAAPGGVKAVAPTGTEPIVVTIPQNVDQVSILGEKLTMERLDGTATYTATGRPIAVVSNLQVRYRPAPTSRRR